MHARLSQARGVLAPSRPELVETTAPAPCSGGAPRLLAAVIAAVVVVVLLGVYAALSVPRLRSARAAGTTPSANPHVTQRAKEAELKANLAEVRAAIEAFHGQYGVYPSELEDLVAGSTPTHGYDDQGNLAQIDPKAGPPKHPLPEGSLPVDPTTGTADWAYDTFHDIGAVHSTSESAGTDGVPYSEL